MRAPDPSAAAERALLLAIAAAAGLAYAWGIGDPLLEWYYAAGARSMALTWHNFAYGAFDPDGLITLDKLPGAIWPQALSIRLFGPHRWAVVLPQVLEGALTVIVLHRAVRRLLGVAAGLTAAFVLAVSPMTVALNRGNIPDTLLTLLLVLAADATSSALVSGRSRSLLMAGAWVGMGFQTKMLQAWIVLPALGAAYAIAAPGTLRRRLGQLMTAGGVTVLVSLSWMTWFSLMPAAGRPQVDGSVRDSIFEQVFLYNGLRRVGGWSPLSDLVQLGLGGGVFEAPPAAWHRLFAGTFGRAAGWLLPAAFVTLIAGFVSTRRAPRTDPTRAGLLLWGTWLVLFVVAFSATSTGWPYYAAVLSPAVAAILGAGVRLLRDRPEVGRSALASVAIVVAVTGLHSAWMLPRDGAGVTPWLRPLLAAAAVLAVVLLAATAAQTRAPAPLRLGGLFCAAVAVLVVPVVATASIVAYRMGPFDTPYEPRSVVESNRAQNARVPDLDRFTQGGFGGRYLLAAQPAILASRFVFLGGHRVVPIGGFTGSHPEPSVAKLAGLVANGEVHLVLAVPSADPRYQWITAHCALRRRFSRAELYSCRRTDALRSGP